MAIRLYDFSMHQFSLLSPLHPRTPAPKAPPFAYIACTMRPEITSQVPGVILRATSRHLTSK